MKVWKVFLGTFITVAVLSLAYGVASKIDGLQQRLTLTEGILEGKVGDIRVLQAALDDKNLQIGELQRDYETLREAHAVLLTANKALQVEHTTLLQEKADLDVTVLSLKTLSLDLQGKLASKGNEYDALSAAVGTLEGVKSQVSGLQQQVQSLNGDIARLQAARSPLIVESYRGGFACTGSMEPKITCLDEATWLSNFRPQDIIVGTVISFTPIAACRLSSTRVAHRVSFIKVESGVYYYLPKGDANSFDDGCWIPSSNVSGYLVSLYKNTKLGNAPIRDRINALKVAYDMAHQFYEQRKVSYDLKLADYQTYVSLYCPGNTCPVQYYSTAQSFFNELETFRLAVNAAAAASNTALAQYNAAIEIERLRP